MSELIYSHLFLGFNVKLLLFCNEFVKNSIRASPVCQFSFMCVISVMKRNLILSFLKCVYYFHVHITIEESWCLDCSK